MLELHDAPDVEHAPPGHPGKCPGRDVRRTIWHVAVRLWPQSAAARRREAESYPGRHASVRAVLGDRVSWESIAAWSLGRRTPPPWANELMANHLRQRARHMLWIADELDKEKPAR